MHTKCWVGEESLLHSTGSEKSQELSQVEREKLHLGRDHPCVQDQEESEGGAAAMAQEQGGASCEKNEN